MKIVFMGTPPAAVATLARILEDGHEVVAVYTQPDKPAGRGNRLAQSAVKEFANENDLTVLQPAKIKTSEATDIFHSHAADVAVVVAYGRILPGSFLTAYPHGAINVHFSLLPKYRGAAPVNWAIANGETRTGVTTMKMDAGLDTGDILLQEETDIGSGETAPDLMSRLAVIGADLLSKTLNDLDQIVPLRQDEAQATLAPILRRSDGLVDWTMTAEAIANRVRGFQPFPGVFSHFGNVVVKVWKAKTAANSDATFAPGEIVSIGDALFVGCGEETMLAIEELQPEGRRRMSARDFVNGIKPKVGDRFESSVVNEVVR